MIFREDEEVLETNVFFPFLFFLFFSCFIFYYCSVASMPFIWLLNFVAFLLSSISVFFNDQSLKVGLLFVTGHTTLIDVD